MINAQCNDLSAIKYQIISIAEVTLNSDVDRDLFQVE